jgi:tetratricopeptide (TPR) repeat protein
MTYIDPIEASMKKALEGKTLQAKKILMDALTQNKDSIEILNALGDLMYLSEEFHDAIHFYEKSLKIFSQQPDILFNVALIHKDSDNLAKALEAYTRLLEIRSNDIECLNNRGNIFRELSLFEKAFQDLNKANEIISNQKIASLYEVEPWVIYLNLGNVLTLMGSYMEASNFFDKGLAIKPNSFELQRSKGVILFHLTYYQEAINHYHAALEIKPHDIEIQLDMAFAHLSIGNYDEGFKCYESRAEVKKLDGAIWTGQEDVSAKVIYVKAEQGLGDVIQFSRYIPMIEDLGAKVYFQVPKPLQNIIRSLGDQFEIVDEMERGFDYYTYLMSLPCIFKTNLHSIPARERYLSTDEERIALWNKKLNRSERYQVGLVWQGGFRENRPDLWHIYHGYRNIACEFLEPLFRLDIDLVSLQKGDEAIDEMKDFLDKHPSFRIKEYSDEIEDFSDTAALIENLDLVISVDTSTLHLAASLGKETWLLNRFNSCWRWNSSNKTRTPWYSSMKIFNQKKLGQWDDVMNDVIKNLKERIM